MGTYFHGGSEIQGDGLQTLYLMNPNFVGYSDTQQQQGNMLFLNSAPPHALNPASVPNAPPSQPHHFVGVPLQAAPIGSDDPGRQSMSFHNPIPRFHYNLWSDQNAAGSILPTAAVVGGDSRNTVTGGPTDFATQLGFRRPAVVPTQQQGLSLSLSPQQPAYRSLQAADHDATAGLMSPRSGPGEGFRGSGHSSSSVSAVSNGISGMQSMILGSKYLQAAQELLDEVVNVRNRVNTEEEGSKEKMKKINRESMGVSDEAPSGSKNGTRHGAELTTAERQEIQMKKAKLVSMLDEVEQRYRQYHHQMQVVVSSFEHAAGIGAAKSYTSLALQTISKQFRCLKDAISMQIKGASKSLGEEDPTEGKPEGSRLKFVDHQLRQQRALQQLGMMQHNAWRPQRGLPERAVSVLRAWLFEHFLHPYPKDSDKHMLAKQTGLTRSQVSNWFINARVRLWKPMVEEMYMEEFKEQDQNNTASADQTTAKTETNKSPNNTQDLTTLQNDQITPQQNPNNTQNTPPNEISTSSITTSPTLTSLQAHQATFSLVGSSTSPKKPRHELQNSPNSILSVEMDMKTGERSKRLELSRDSYQLLAGSASNGGGFGDYTLGELGRYNPEQFTTGFHGNGVSLTLGLPHGENSLSLSEAHQNYLSDHTINQFGSRHNMGGVESHFSGINPPQGSHSNAGYENINIQNRKRFAAQLLHDFVA